MAAKIDCLRCSAALSTDSDTSAAMRSVCADALAALGAKPDLAMVFVSPHHVEQLPDAANMLCDALETEAVLGCTGESIVGGDREIEGDPAISLWLARLPGVEVHTMHLEFNRSPDGGSFAGWPDDVDLLARGASVLMLGEPFSFPADTLLARLNEDCSGLAVQGGMASGGWNSGQNRLLHGRRMWDSGAVATLLRGPVRVRSVVSQGCRPIGKPMIITRSDRNVIFELSGKSAMDQLRELWTTLPAADQRLVQSGLHVGQVINEYQEQFGRGDFLVRNVVGADPETGVIAIGDYVRTGQTVQFHIRDAQTADEDLRELLADAQRDGSRPAGALLFTCNGRGTRLFPEPHHDAGAVAAQWSNLPVAGLFAQGEIGPVGGKNFLHGFTASVALIEPAE